MGDEQARGGNGRFLRTSATAERDAAAADLRARGYTYPQIAQELGYADKGEAWRAVDRALKAIVREPAERVRDMELSRLDALYEHALAVLERQHVTVSNGKVVTLGGDPLPDDAPVLQAIDRLLKIMERRARYLGLDAPSRVSVDAEHLGAEIIAMLTAAADGGEPDDDRT